MTQVSSPPFWGQLWRFRASRNGRRPGRRRAGLTNKASPMVVALVHSGASLSHVCLSLQSKAIYPPSRGRALVGASIGTWRVIHFRRMIDIVPRLLSSFFASIFLQGRLMHGMHGMGQSLCSICFMRSISIDHSSVEVRPFVPLRMIESFIGFCLKSATSR
jgi:hypothetical protein